MDGGIVLELIMAFPSLRTFSLTVYMQNMFSSPVTIQSQKGNIRIHHLKNTANNVTLFASQVKTDEEFKFRHYKFPQLKCKLFYKLYNVQ